MSHECELVPICYCEYEHHRCHILAVCLLSRATCYVTDDKLLIDTQLYYFLTSLMNYTTVLGVLDLSR